jgi:hypothetical protein
MAESDSEFIEAARAIAEERYAGAFDRGFAHVALQVSAPTMSLSDDEAFDAISVDRAGDLGCDGLLIDNEEQNIFIFQSKSSPALPPADLHKIAADLITTGAKLKNPAWYAHAHEDMRGLAEDFKTAESDGFRTTYILATNSTISPTVRALFAEDGELGKALEPATVELLDPSDLASRYQKLLLGQYGQSTNVLLEVAEKGTHEPVSDERVVYATVAASEYARECKKWGMELFRFNPRLYLGPNKVNLGIAETLKNAAERKHFHLLSNGITAVCDDIVVNEIGDGRVVIKATNFQVVNGCQTTMTLIRNLSEFVKDPRCMVDLKIVQSTGLRARISDTTNSQTSIFVEDSFANAPEQRHIAELLRHYTALPYYYAPKRGAWERELPSLRKKYEVPKGNLVFGRHRKVTSKELAAVALAVFGEAGSAKDKPRSVFEKTSGKPSPWYARIFEEPTTAQQWILPTELFRHVNGIVTAQPEESEGRETGAYGRYYMLYLVYRYLKKHEAQADYFLTPLSSERLLASVEHWAPKLSKIALDAVVKSFKEALKDGKTNGLREFFRSKDAQGAIEAKFDDVLGTAEDVVRNMDQDFGVYLGLPAPV